MQNLFSKFTKNLAAKAAPALTIVMALSLAACGANTDVDKKDAKEELFEISPAVWVAEDDDNRLYLFGTVPFLPQGANWEGGDVKSALGDAETVMLEMDGSDAARIEALLQTQELGLYKDGNRLSDRLDGYQSKLLEASAHNANLPLGTLENMKPWLASEIMAAAAAESAGLSTENSVAGEIDARAKAKGKTVVYLDAVAQQIEDSAGLSEEAQIALLRNTMEAYETLGAKLKKTAEDWEAGEVAKMTNEYASVYAQHAPETYASFLAARNARWTAQFTDFMKGTEDGFAVVDMGHLLGHDSLQFLLREKGYTVRRYRGTTTPE